MILIAKIFQSTAQDTEDNGEIYVALDAENEYDIVGEEFSTETISDKNNVQNDTVTGSDQKDNEVNSDSETGKINDLLEKLGEEIGSEQEQDINAEEVGEHEKQETPKVDAATEGQQMNGESTLGEIIEENEENETNATAKQEISSLPVNEDEQELGASAEEQGSGSNVDGDSHPPLNQGEHPAQNNTELDIHKHTKNKTQETHDNIEQVVDNSVDPEEKYLGCSDCAPGYGVITVCNATHDTVCGACPPGTFSAVYSAELPCEPCGVCSEGYYQRTPCVAMQDVNCVLCFNGGGGFGNEDFLRKCETTTTTVTNPATTTTTAGMRSTTVEIPGVRNEHKTTRTTSRPKTPPKTSVTAKQPTKGI